METTNSIVSSSAPEFDQWEKMKASLVSLLGIIGIPILGVGLFLMLWSAGAARVDP